MDKRVPVAVQIRTDTSGEITPLAIEWPDGRTFEIARVENRGRVTDNSGVVLGEKARVVVYNSYIQFIYREVA